MGPRQNSKKKVTGKSAVGENNSAQRPDQQFSSGNPAELGQLDS
jgi:hypothetical protein